MTAKELNKMFRFIFILSSVTSMGLAKFEGYSLNDINDISLTPKKSFNDDQNTSAQMVELKLFYETMCPHCVNFFPEFVKVVEKLRNNLYVSIHPYGNARMTRYPDGKVTVKCQHGERECYGNKIHACAMSFIKDGILLLNYDSCLMGLRSDDAAIDECGKQLGIPINQIDAIKICAKSEMGHNLLVRHGEVSEEAGFQHVPYILIDDTEWEHEGDFMAAVCKAFSDPPKPCNQI